MNIDLHTMNIDLKVLYVIVCTKKCRNEQKSNLNKIKKI